MKKWAQDITDLGLVDRAVAFAAMKHAGQFRKGTTIPYITHVVEALAIVSTLTEDAEVRAAAVLHDTLEDTRTTREELEEYFGKRVAALVAAESENKREDQPAEETWLTRKQETINHLAEASHEARIIALGDKLSNIRAMHRDYEEIGEELWERFNEKDPVNQGMYYGLLANVFGADENIRETAAYREYVKLASEVFGTEYTFEDEKEETESEDSGLHLGFFFTDAMEDVRAKTPEGGKAWALIMDQTQDEELKEFQKLAVVVDALLRTEEIGFGDVRLVISNDPEGNSTSWQRTPDGYAIGLSADIYKNWCHAAYQMGYALMHCLIDHLNQDRVDIAWAEELISEAAALELMYQMYQRWNELPYDKDSDARENIKAYIEQIENDPGKLEILLCGSREELQEISERVSIERHGEGYALFNTMKEGDLQKLAQVRKYAADHLLMYTRWWRHSSDESEAIDYLCSLQEQIPECDIPAGITHELDLKDSAPSEEQITAYGNMMRSLRDLPEEHIIFDFMDADKEDGEQEGLVFIQASRASDNELDFEIRVDTESRRRMYQMITDDNQAVNIMEHILLTKEVPELEAWEEITDRVFEKKEDFFPGIPLDQYLNNLSEWIENPSWKEYFEKAPSIECQTLIGLEFYYSEYETDAAIEAMEIVENDLSLEDWEYLYKHCRNNPRKSMIHNKIMDLKLADQFKLLNDIRNNPDDYYPLIDHACWKYEEKTDSGDVNIGWNIGLLEEKRPWFAECWATDGLTMLTYFVSTSGIEHKTPEQLSSILESAGIVKFVDSDHDNTPAVKVFTDKKGNEFYSINILVGDEENTYVTKDSGLIHSFRELNRFNEQLEDGSAQ